LIPRPPWRQLISIHPLPNIRMAVGSGKKYPLDLNDIFAFPTPSTEIHLSILSTSSAMSGTVAGRWASQIGSGLTNIDPCIMPNCPCILVQVLPISLAKLWESQKTQRCSVLIGPNISLNVRLWAFFIGIIEQTGASGTWCSYISYLGRRAHL
jgi:hypothetical protein